MTRAVILIALGLITATLGLSAPDLTAAGFRNSTANAGNVVAAATLAAPTGLTAAGAPTATLNWTASTSAFTQGYNIYRSSVASGPYSLVGTTTSTTYQELPGANDFYYVVKAYYSSWLSADSNEAVRIDPTYYFASSGNNTATNCASSGALRDMIKAYTPTDPGENAHRNLNNPLNFCTPSFTAGQTLAAGTTTAYVWTENTSGSGCAIYADLAVNGSTTLASASVNHGAWAGRQARPFEFTHAGHTFAEGDRLTIRFTWASVKSCNSTPVLWDGAATNSSIVFSGLG